jgi:hypothetical protein
MDYTELQNAMSRIVAKAWADPEYKARLMSDPASVFAEAGHPMAGRQIHVHENTPAVFHLVLPPQPTDIGPPEETHRHGTVAYTIHEVEL